MNISLLNLIRKQRFLMAEFLQYTAVVEERAEQTEGLKTLCIKIGYSEQTRAESREESSTQTESSRVTHYSILIA